MIRYCVLRPEQFDEVLPQIHDGFVPDPRTSIAIVGFDDGRPVARVFLMSPAHIEGPYIEESLRNGIEGLRLMDAVEWEAQRAGIKKLLAYAVDETIEGYLTRLGFTKMQMTVWSKEI